MPGEYTANCTMETDPETVRKLFGEDSIGPEYIINVHGKMTADDIHNISGKNMIKEILDWLLPIAITLITGGSAILLVYVVGLYCHDKYGWR